MHRGPVLTRGAFVVAAMLGLVAACGDDDDTGAVDAAAVDAPASASLTVTVSVPNTFAGPAVRMIVGFYESLPAAGPPNIAGVDIMNPAIAVGTPLNVEITDIAASGDYYVVVTLFTATRVIPAPVAGEDYVGQSDSAYAIGVGAVAADPIELVLLPGT